MATTGATVEEDVFLGVDGSQIKTAFDAIDARIRGIQQNINLITTRSAEAAKAFGGSLQGQINQLSKMASQIDAFYKTIERQQKLDPSFQKREDINKAYALREKAQVDAENRAAQQSATLWGRYDRERVTAAQKLEATKERLATQRWERERAQATAAEREQARLSQQMQFKNGRETMRADVDNAKTLKDLENQRVVAAERIASARGMLGKFGAQEDAQLHLIVAQERERLRLAESRIRTEQSTLQRTANSDSRIDAGLNVRSARIDEKEAAIAMTSLNAAKTRQAELEARITAQIERTRIATGQEKIEAERALKVEEARLGVINARVRQLEVEARKQAAAGQLPPTRPPGGGGGSGLFGASGVGGIFARTAAYGGAAALIYSTISALRDGISFSLQYQDAIAKLGAISGATATQQEELRKTIADVGKESRFSTLELADAATTLAQAGFTQDEIAQSLKGISQLATASGVSIAEATDVVTSAIGSFQLQAGETAHINDVLASALNRTKLNIQQVALGIQYAGATAHENNISFEELTATMATMAQAGIRSGSTIGTGIRQFLVDLQTPTKKLAEELTHLGLTMQDIDINKLGLPEVLKRLSDAGFDSAAAYKTLETRAAAAYLVLKNNRQEIQEQIIAQNQIGQSAAAAAKGQDSLSAEWQRFKNILNDSVSNGLKPAEEALQSYLHRINEFNSDPNVQRLLNNKDTIALPGIGLKTNQELSEYLRLKQDLADAEAEHAGEIEQTTTALNKATDEVNKQKTSLQSIDGAMERVNVRQKQLSGDQVALQAEVATLTNRFSGLAKYLDGAALSYNNLTTALHLYRLEQARALGTALISQGVAGRQQSGAQIRNANSLMQAAVSDGTFGGLPRNVQALMKQLVQNPGNDVLRRQVSDAAVGLQGVQKQFVDSWVVSIDKGVNAFRDAGKALFQADVVGHLTHGKGAILQQQVDSLAGKSDAVIKATVAQLQAQSKGKTGSAKAAYDQLIEAALGYLGSGNAPEAPASKKKKGNNAAERLQNRQDATMLRLSLRADEAELRQAIKGLLDPGGEAGIGPDGSIQISKSRTLTADKLKANIDRVDKSLDAWIEDRTAQVKEQISSEKMDPKEAKAMLDDLAREIDAKKEEVSRQIGEAISKALDVMVKAIEDTAKRAEEEADHRSNLAQARVSSLDRTDLQGRVPDYVRATYERAASRAKDQRDLDQISIQEQELVKLRDAAQQVAMYLDQAGSEGLLAKDDPAVQRLKDLNDQIYALQNNTDELKATFGGEGLIPQTFQDNLRLAIENFREVNHVTASWTEMISMNLTDALNNARDIGVQFFSDILSGTTSMRDAFKNMVRAVLQYLTQLIAKMIVVKLLGMALNLFSPGAGASAVNIGSSAVASGTSSIDSSLGSILGFYYGGQPKKAYTGRYITAGVPSRDSVNMRIAKGEYVVRKSAVDSVGVDFMNSLNERGASALKNLGPKIVVPPPAQQEMNVYLLPKDEQPQLGPNDVLLTIANDIYRGGPTKQLIKQVIQGG